MQASPMNSFATTRWGWVFRIKFSAMRGASVSPAWPRSSGRLPERPWPVFPITPISNLWSDDDDVYLNIGERLKLEGGTENMGVCTKEREGRGSRGTRKVDLCLFSFFAKTFRPIIY